jgi:hypothetical protein
MGFSRVIVKSLVQHVTTNSATSTLKIIELTTLVFGHEHMGSQNSWEDFKDVG